MHNACMLSEIIKRLFFSWLRSMWPSMKVKVNIINTWCMLMSEAVTVPSLTMMPSTVSEESFVRDTHTDTRTDFGLVYVDFFKVRKTLKTKRRANAQSLTRYRTIKWTAGDGSTHLMWPWRLCNKSTPMAVNKQASWPWGFGRRTAWAGWFSRLQVLFLHTHNAHMHTHTHAHTHTHTHTSMHASTHPWTHTYTHAHTCIHKWALIETKITNTMKSQKQRKNENLCAEKEYTI